MHLPRIQHNMLTPETCPHCNHAWKSHSILIGDRKRCLCDCRWSPPEPPKPPPTEHELLVAKVRAAIYAELNAQHEADEIDGAGYWDDEWGRLDGEPNWDRIAAAAITAVRHADAETA